MSEPIPTVYPLDRAKSRIVNAALQSMPVHFLIALPDTSGKQLQCNLLAAIASRLGPKDDPRHFTYATLDRDFTTSEIEAIVHLVGNAEGNGLDRYDRVYKEILKWTGLDLYKKDDRVVVKAGVQIESVNPKLAVISNKERTVTVAYAECGFPGKGIEGDFRSEPKVGWAGSNGDWCWTHPDNVELVELARIPDKASRAQRPDSLAPTLER